MTERKLCEYSHYVIKLLSVSLRHTALFCYTTFWCKWALRDQCHYFNSSWRRYESVQLNGNPFKSFNLNMLVVCRKKKRIIWGSSEDHGPIPIPLPSNAQPYPYWITSRSRVKCSGYMLHMLIAFNGGPSNSCWDTMSLCVSSFRPYPNSGAASFEGRILKFNYVTMLREGCPNLKAPLNAPHKAYFSQILEDALLLSITSYHIQWFFACPKKKKERKKERK